MKRELTPFATITIDTGDSLAWAKFYWSKNSGTYGHQVITEYYLPTFEIPIQVKTGGCGFCKESDALGTFIVEYFGGYKNLPENHSGIGGCKLDNLVFRAGLPRGRDIALTHEGFVKLVTKKG